MATQRIAAVSGANRGIGLEVSRQLAALGYTVVLGARDPAKGEAAAKELGGNARALPLDVADGPSVVDFAGTVRNEFGRCDVLVNNAGIHYDARQRGSTADLGIVHETFE